MQKNILSYISIKRRRINGQKSLGKLCGNMLQDCKHAHIIWPNKLFQHLGNNLKETKEKNRQKIYVSESLKKNIKIRKWCK